MKKLRKRWLALLLAAATMLSLAIPALADDEEEAVATSGTLTGTATFVDGPSDHIFKVVFPTVAEDDFNFKMDPKELIKKTAGKSQGENAKAWKYDTNANIYFKNTISDTKVEYTKETNYLWVINKSNSEIELEVNAVITNVGSMKLLNSDARTKSDFTRVNSAGHLFVGMVSSGGVVDSAGGPTKPETVVPLSDGAGDKGVKLDFIIPQVTGAYVVKAEEVNGVATGGFVYEVDKTAAGFPRGAKTTAITDTDANIGSKTAWTKAGFKLAGFVNSDADWEGIDFTKSPTLTLTYKIVDPLGVPHVKGRKTTIKMTLDKATDIVFDMGNPENANASVQTVTHSTVGFNDTNASTMPPRNNWGWDGNTKTFTLAAGHAKADKWLTPGQINYVTLTFNDKDKTTVKLKVTG